MEKRNQVISLIVNSIIFISTLIIAGAGIFFGAGQGQVGTAVIGLRYLMPFTMDSNILSGLSAFIIVLFTINNLKNKEDRMPRWAITLHLMASASLFLTFIVAALFLAPMNVLEGKSYFTMFADDMFFFHLVNPVLSFYSFTCLQKKYLYQRKDRILGMIPTILYSFIYLFMVVIIKVWDDFYNFTFGGKYFLIPFVFIVIYSLVFIFSTILIHFHNKKTSI